MQTVACDAAQVVLVVRHSRAQATHGERRAHHHGVSQFLGCFEAFVHGVGDAGAGHFSTAGFDDVFELLTVFATFNCVDVGTDEFNAVFVEYAGLVQVDGRVECGLSTQGGQKRVRAFLCDDRFDDFGVDRFDVSGIRDVRVGHDGGWVRVDQDDAQAF